MARTVRVCLILVYAAALVGGPWWYHDFQKKRFRNFRVVTPGQVYRSGQLSPEGLEQIAREYGIRTVISFRDQDGSRSDPSQWEEEYCRAQGIRFVRIRMLPWWAAEGTPPAQRAAAEFLDVLRNEEQYPRPVLMHCYAGIHRTGAFCALYRMEFERWPAAPAVAEMGRCGYDRIDDEWDVLGFIQAFEPSWKRGQ